MMEKIETVEYKGYDIDIYPDESPLNPREDFDNLGIMVCFHRRYGLGDKTKLTSDMFDSWGELHEYLVKVEKAVVIIPLRMLDHGNIWIEAGTGSFSCDPGGWDSGTIGFIYTTKERIKEWFQCRKVTKKQLEHAEKNLRGEIKTYGHYVSGCVYGFKIEEIDDSCWGFFGDYEESGLLDDAKSQIDWHIKNEKEKHSKKLKAQIKANTPLDKREALTV